MGPKGVSVDRNGHIIVVDNKACCVFIFQPNGKIVTRFGTRGNGDKQFAGKLHNMWATFSCGIFPDIAWIIHTRDYLQKECHLREALGPVFFGSVCIYHSNECEPISSPSLKRIHISL